jgi:hypothetical protein
VSAQKGFVFSAEDLYQLLVHYTDGECPLEGVVRQVGVNPYLERMVGLFVESDEWQEAEPLQVRYDPQRGVASWSEGKESMEWGQRAETPKLQ